MSAVPELDPFTVQENVAAERVADVGRRADNMAAITAALTAWFGWYTWTLRRRLKAEVEATPPASGASLYELMSRLFEQTSVRVVATLVPSLISGYRFGLAEAKAVPLSSEWLDQIATAHAQALVDHINNVSGQALVEGFQAQLNRRIAARAAIDRTIDAFGVAPSTMKALVNVWTAKALPVTGTASQMSNPLKDRADKLVARAIMDRAHAVGTAEAYSAKNQAKAIVWLYQQSTGEIPPESTKVWRTARDERVCKICGPMDKVRVHVDEQFTLPTKDKVWAPGVHPNCRCNISLRPGDMRLVENTVLIPDQPVLGEDLDSLPVAKSAWGVVSKARGTDPYDRDRHGRFAAVEQRAVRKPTLTKVAEVDPKVAALIAQLQAERERPVPAAAKLAVPEKIVTPAKLTAPPKLSTTPKLSVTQQPDKVVAPKLTLPKVQLGKVSVDAQQAKIAVEAKTKLAKVLLTPPPPIDLRQAQAVSDKWVVNPDSKPSYGLFDPMSNRHHREGALLYADDATPFYTGGQHGRGIPTMEEAIAQYWEDFFEGDVRSMWREHADPDSQTVEVIDGPHLLYVPWESYQAAWKETVLGLNQDESTYMPVLQMDPDDPEFDGDEDFVTGFELARMLGLHQQLDQHIPVIGVAYMRNVGSDAGYWGGIMTNPGKWRVTSGNLGPSKLYAGRGESTYPYYEYTIEPDDLFD